VSKKYLTDNTKLADYINQLKADNFELKKKVKELEKKVKILTKNDSKIFNKIDRDDALWREEFSKTFKSSFKE